jgi:plasmid stabilization system protein ParE
VKRIVFRVEARDDLDEVVRWYGAQREGLGDEFLQEFEGTLEGVASNPLRYARLHRDVRCARLRRFPYGMFFYVFREEMLVVLAVMHEARDPKRWKERR